MHPFRSVTKTIFDPSAEQFAALFGCEGRARCSEALFDKCCGVRAESVRTRRDVPHSAGAQSSQVPAERDARPLAAPLHYARKQVLPGKQPQPPECVE